MQYDARQIANWFLKRSLNDGKQPSIMTLLKLVYIAHGWNLEIKNGAPLFNNRIEAWRYGPVIPDVYHSFRKQGVHANRALPEFPSTVDENTHKFLEQIYNIYGSKSAFQLSDITHEVGGPWHTASKWGGYYAEIPNDLIHSHYITKRQLAENHNG